MQVCIAGHDLGAHCVRTPRRPAMAGAAQQLRSQQQLDFVVHHEEIQRLVHFSGARAVA